jgi:hypothetical protein
MHANHVNAELGPDVSRSCPSANKDAVKIGEDILQPTIDPLSNVWVKGSVGDHNDRSHGTLTSTFDPDPNSMFEEGVHACATTAIRDEHDGFQAIDQNGGQECWFFICENMFGESILRGHEQVEADDVAECSGGGVISHVLNRSFHAFPAVDRGTSTAGTLSFTFTLKSGFGTLCTSDFFHGTTEGVAASPFASFAHKKFFSLTVAKLWM